MFYFSTYKNQEQGTPAPADDASDLWNLFTEKNFRVMLVQNYLKPNHEPGETTQLKASDKEFSNKIFKIPLELQKNFALVKHLNGKER